MTDQPVSPPPAPAPVYAVPGADQAPGPRQPDPEPEAAPEPEAEPEPEPEISPLEADDDAPEPIVNEDERKAARRYEVPSSQPAWLRDVIDHLDHRLHGLEH
jgi:DNA polymerase-3 subunit gamma/tau